jgi:hypothetical protein
MKKIEIVGWSLFALSLLLDHFVIHSIVLPLLCSISLAFIYFYFFVFIVFDIKIRKIFSQESYQKISSRKILFTIILGVVYSFLLVALFFAIAQWPGTMSMLIYCFGLYTIIGAVLVAKIINAKTEYLISLLKRHLIIYLFCVLALIVEFIR